MKDLPGAFAPDVPGAEAEALDLCKNAMLKLAKEYVAGTIVSKTQLYQRRDELLKERRVLQSANFPGVLEATLQDKPTAQQNGLKI